MAVNFVQHNRCTSTFQIRAIEVMHSFIDIDFFCSPTVNIHDESERLRRQRQHEQARRQQDGTRPQGTKRATDDYHYDKFKKQFRRFQ